MGVKSEVEYTPQKVAKGLRDYIAWKTRIPSKVEIFDMGAGYEARVELPTAAKTSEPDIERELKALLPDAYHLKLTWTD